MFVKNIDHIVITTHDLDACLHFYCDLLGLKHVIKEGRHAIFTGNQKINLHTRPAEFLPAAKHPTYGSMDFCFIVDGNIEDIKKELEEKGIPVEVGVVPKNGSHGKMLSVYVRDPDENLVELSTYIEE